MDKSDEMNYGFKDIICILCLTYNGSRCSTNVLKPYRLQNITVTASYEYETFCKKRNSLKKVVDD